MYKKYSVTISDQIDDEGNETHYIVTGTDMFMAMDRVIERHHDMIQAKKITVVERPHDQT